MIKKIFKAYHFLWAALCAVFYGFPSNRLIVIGVTGTTGKSTTVEMISAILEKAGFKTASSSSIRFKIDDKVQANLMKQTMPGRGYLQRFLRQALDADCRYAVLEVTSEGIGQYRHRFINFDVAVLTNLTPEHIESHGGFENYKRAKQKLFAQLALSPVKTIGDRKIPKSVVINSRTPQLETFLYKNASVVKFDSEKTKNLDLKLFGDFWYSNANAALAVTGNLGVDRSLAIKALNDIESIPGRMEELKQGQNFQVFVDYAHTPDALEQVYKFLSSEVKRLKLNNLETNKLICVLGAAGGGRDKWKRPEFGKLAAQYCDEIFITNEDPYDEKPEEIMRQVTGGIPEDKLLMTKLIIDRRQAITAAINLAKAGDVLVITGKGCEPWLMVEGGRKIPWDDRDVVKEALK